MKHKGLLVTGLLMLFAASASGFTTDHVGKPGPAHHATVVAGRPGPHEVVVVHRRPPAPRREVRGRRPSASHVWVGGYWAWRGGRYVWVKGAYVKAPRHGAAWVAGHWQRHRGGWTWVPGHWRY